MSRENLKIEDITEKDFLPKTMLPVHLRSNVNVRPKAPVIAGLSVAIVGIGRKGVAVARLVEHFGGVPFLSEKEPAARLGEHLNEVDERGWVYEVGGHSDRILKCDCIVRCSAAPVSLPLLHRASSPVMDEVDFASAFVAKPIVAVTGTNGKPLVLRMFVQMAEVAGLKAVSAGGAGVYLSDVALGLAQGKLACDFVAVEASAVQLDGALKYLRPVVGCLTQIPQDYFGRFGSLDRYVAATERLFSLQEGLDVLVTDCENPRCWKVGVEFKGTTLWVSRKNPNASVWIRDGLIWTRGSSGAERIIALEELHVPVRHVDSALIACGLAKALELKAPDITGTLKGFVAREVCSGSVRRACGIASDDPELDA